MERRTDFQEIRALFGKNFIGPDELSQIQSKLPLSIPTDIPEIDYYWDELVHKSKDYLLFLTIPSLTTGEKINILSLREIFGMDPNKSEPCFYNQDWYVHEEFATKELNLEWKLLKKSVFEETRAVYPDRIKLKRSFPEAIVCAFAFFTNYLINQEILWQYDYIWCLDVDHNSDRIYVGKYCDIDGVNKNGFSVHRHLSINKKYGYIEFL